MTAGEARIARAAKKKKALLIVSSLVTAPGSELAPAAPGPALAGGTFQTAATNGS